MSFLKTVTNTVSTIYNYAVDLIMPSAPFTLISVNPTTCVSGQCPQQLSLTGTGFKSNMHANMGVLSRVSSTKAILTVTLTTPGQYSIFLTKPSGAVSNTVIFVVQDPNGDFPPPPPVIILPPSTVSAVGNVGSITLNWSNSATATSYACRRSLVSGGPYSTLGSTLGATTLTDSTVVTGTPYYYVVTASNSTATSVDSVQASATATAVITPPTPPAAPTSVSCTPTSATNTLFWAAATGAATYTVQRSLTSGSGYVTIASGITALTYVNTGLTNGTTYYYVVKAVNSAGDSPISAQVSGTPAGAIVTRYVSTTGNDSASGAIGTPWLTLGHAIPQLQAGDTLYLRSGTYTGSANRITDELLVIRSGTSGNPITIAGYPGEVVTIQSPNGTDAIHLREAPHAYLTFQDLIIDGILNTSSSIVANVLVENVQDHIRFVRVEVKDGWYSGIKNIPSGTASGIEFIDCTIHGNGRQPDASEVSGIPGTSGYGIYSVSGGTIFDGLNVYGNHGFGVFLSGSNNILRSSTIHNNGTATIGSGQALGVNFGVNIGVSTTPASAGNLVYNNLIYSNRGGIRVYTLSSATGVYNNTIYGNGPSPAITVQAIAGDATFRNNIIYGNTDNTITNGGGFTGGAIVQDHNLFTDPSFVDSASANFHLLTGSTAKDTGTVVASVTVDYDDITRPQNGSYDIGAFEYVSTTGTTYTVGLGGDFQAALDAAQPGDTIKLTDGGTYHGNFVVKNKGGTSSSYITITRTGALPAIPNMMSSASRATFLASMATAPVIYSDTTVSALSFELGAKYYKFIGVDISTTWNTTNFTHWFIILSGYDGLNTNNVALTVDQLPDHISFDRVYIHGGPNGDVRQAFLCNMRTMEFINSYVSIHGIDPDNQCLQSVNGRGPYTVKNNFMQSAGENVLIGGGGGPSTAIVGLIDGFLFEGNYLTKDFAWRGTLPHWGVKNIFELKNCQNATIRGNVFENCWADNQDGTGVLFTVRAFPDKLWITVKNIVFENNIIRHCPQAINILGLDDLDPGTPRADNIIIRNNLSYDIDGPAYGGNGQWLKASSCATNLQVYHNTADNVVASTNGIMQVNTAEAVSGFVFRDNMVRHGTYGFISFGLFGTNFLNARFPGYTWLKNVLGGLTDAFHLLSEYPAGTFAPTNAVFDAQFTNQGARNYQLVPGSPYRLAASDGTDIGVDFTQIPVDN